MHQISEDDVSGLGVLLRKFDDQTFPGFRHCIEDECAFNALRVGKVDEFALIILKTRLKRIGALDGLWTRFNRFVVIIQSGNRFQKSI